VGRLIDGEWVTHDLGPDAQGRYVRRAAKFRNWIRADDSGDFPVEAGRYHLIISWACGWSHRTLLVHRLKGLRDAVPVHFVEPFMGEHGWTFGAQGDPLHGSRHLYELYTRARPDYTGRASVPLLWDGVTDTAVSNESADIMRMFDHELDAVARHPDLTYFPANRLEEIDEMIAANYGPINNGVYRAGFAGSQAAHEEAVRDIFGRLDELEALLSQRRYLLGPEITAADWCLFHTLYRFDSVYYTHFKANVRHIWAYPNLWGYTLDLYQQPGVAETCDMAATKAHYYTSHESIHPRRYVPLGPAIDWEAPHGRQALGGGT